MLCYILLNGVLKNSSCSKSWISWRSIIEEPSIVCNAANEIIIRHILKSYQSVYLDQNLSIITTMVHIIWSISYDSYDPCHMVDMMAYYFAYIILSIPHKPYQMVHMIWIISDLYKHMIDWVFENRISFIWLKLTWISKKQIHLKQDMKSHCSVFLVVEPSQKYIFQLKLFTWLTVRKASAQFLKLVLLYIHFWKHFERYSFDRMVVFTLLRCQQPTTMILYRVQYSSRKCLRINEWWDKIFRVFFFYISYENICK